MKNRRSNISDSVSKELEFDKVLSLLEGFAQSSANKERIRSLSILRNSEKLNYNLDLLEEFNTKNIESQNVITTSLKDYFDELQEKITNLPEVKYYDKDIKEVKKDLSKLRTKFDDTGLDISELRNIVKELKEAQKQSLQENLLAEPPEVDNEDPLTPLDTNFVTLDQLQEHYRLFVNRVQQQLASFGGGGETKLQYLDDIVGIATNLSAYDGMYLRLDTSQPAGKNFVFETVASAGAGGTWGVGSAGISTTKNVGIGTTAKSDYALDVEGNARITGIVTVGRSTITLNPNTNIVTVGTGITLDSTNNQILIGGSKVADSSGDANYTGIITASEFKGNLTGNVTGDVSGNITGSACTITTGNFTNVTIGGTLTYEDVTNIDSVGLITARSGVDFGSSGIVRIESVSSTKTSTSQAAIDTFDAETWQSGSYQIQIRRGTAYHITSLNLVHSGGTVYMTEFGTIKTGVSLATFDSDINSGNVRILATPSSSDSTVFKMSRTLITS